MRIGILTSAWFQRGLAYTALAFRNALFERHTVKILACTSEIHNQRRITTRDEFDVPNLCVYPKDEVSRGDLEVWLQGVDVVLFMEERFGDYLVVAKEMGKKTVNYLCEPLSPKEREMLPEFDLVISPHDLGSGVERIELGVDTKLFKPKKKDNEKARIFFPVGWGGDYDRKNHEAVLKALSRVQCRNRTESLVSSHYGRPDQPMLTIDHTVKHLLKVMPRAELAETYAESDVVVYVPKWPRGDLTVMEALASGCAVVTMGIPEMKKFVDGTGKAIPVGGVEQHDGLWTGACVPDIERMAVEIYTLTEDRDMLSQMSQRARELALELFDWKKNKDAFVKMVEGI